MARTVYGSARSVTSILREDGTVYFAVQYAPKPVSERVLDWTLAGLWLMVAAVLVATAFSI
ncbi:MAG TPA: hypothetical protein VFB93_26200 [Burkholderiales bacterium]|nr:hypothetical protein [Burkholderiales bacterium]